MYKNVATKEQMNYLRKLLDDCRYELKKENLKKGEAQKIIRHLNGVDVMRDIKDYIRVKK